MSDKLMARNCLLTLQSAFAWLMLIVNFPEPRSAATQKV